MVSLQARRWLAIGIFGAAASTAAFGLGASLAKKLDHHTSSVSVAKVPVHELMESRRTPPPSAMAARQSPK